LARPFSSAKLRNTLTKIKMMPAVQLLSASLELEFEIQMLIAEHVETERTKLEDLALDTT
jgi:hypothetical protein